MRPYVLLLSGMTSGCGADVTLGTEARSSGATDEIVWIMTPDDATSPAEGTALALSADGKIGAFAGYVTPNDALGRPNRDAYVAAFDPDGHWLWSRTFDFAGKPDQALDVVITAQNEIIVGGTMSEANDGRRGWMRKWSPKGDLLWATIEPTLGSEVVEGLALTAGEKLIAIGYRTSFETGKDVWIWTYDANTGEPFWGGSYNGPLSGDDEARAVSVWNSGAIWVAGYRQTTLGAGNELMVIEWKPDGAQQGVRAISREGKPVIGDVARLELDELTGDNYICATSTQPDGAGGVMTLFRLNYRGEAIWDIAQPGEPGEVAALRGCSLRSSSVVLVGTATATTGAHQLVAARYDTSGNRSWLRRPAGLATGNAVVVAVDGTSYVAGSDTRHRASLVRLRP